MIFTDAPEVQRGVTLEDLPGSFGSALGASASQALYNSPTAQLYRTYEDSQAGGKTLDYETARTRAKDAGVDIRIDPKGIGEDALNLLIDRKRTTAKANDAMARGPQGFLPGTAYFLSGMGASLLDPINVASSFIPIARPLGMAKDIARAGTLGAEGAAATAAGRFAARARVGAVEGAGGQALVEPLTAYRASQEQEDYGITDTLLNIGFGTVLGSVAHGGLGALGDRAVAAERSANAKALIDAAKTAPEQAKGVNYDVPAVWRKDSAAAKLQNSDMATQATTARAAIASEMDGRMMNLEMLVPEKAALEVPTLPPGEAKQFTLRDGTVVTVEKQLDQNSAVFADGYTPKESDFNASLIVKNEAGETIGYLDYQPGSKSIMTEVNEGYRRKGIGTLLYDIAEKAGADLSGDARALGTVSEDALALRANRAARAEGDLMGGARVLDPNAPKPDVDPLKVQEAVKTSMLPENDVHFDAQAKAEVDEAIATKSADREPADIVNESLLEMQTELATLQKQMGIDPEKNAAMRAADETVATADKYTKAIEAYATCQVRT